MRIHITRRLTTLAAVAAVACLAGCFPSPTAVTHEGEELKHPRASSTTPVATADSTASLSPDLVQDPSSAPGECDASLSDTCHAIQPWY